VSDRVETIQWLSRRHGRPTDTSTYSSTEKDTEQDTGPAGDIKLGLVDKTRRHVR